MPKKCYVHGCTSGVTQTFKFPQASIDRTRFLTWLAACGNNTLLKVPPLNLRNRTLCIHHFEPKYILSKKLSSAAIPTLCLPGKIDVSQYEFDNFKENDSRKEYPDNYNESKQQVLQSISLNTSKNPQQETIEDTLDPISDSPIEQLLFVQDENNTHLIDTDTIKSTLESSERPSSNGADLKRKREINDDVTSASSKRSRQIKRRVEGKNDKNAEFCYCKYFIRLITAVCNTLFGSSKRNALKRWQYIRKVKRIRTIMQTSYEQACLPKQLRRLCNRTM